MQILIEPGGTVRCLYGEAIELATLGPLQIARASHVEPTSGVALKVADYGYVLENGRISVHGPADKLRDDPAVKAAYLGG